MYSAPRVTRGSARPLLALLAAALLLLAPNSARAERDGTSNQRGERLQEQSPRAMPDDGDSDPGSMLGACICGAGSCGRAEPSRGGGVAQDSTSTSTSAASCSCGFSSCSVNKGRDCECGPGCPGLHIALPADSLIGPASAVSAPSSCNCGFKSCAGGRGQACACGSDCPGLKSHSSTIPIDDKSSVYGSDAMNDHAPAASSFGALNEKFKELAKAQVEYDQTRNATEVDPKLKKKNAAAKTAIDKLEGEISKLAKPGTLEEEKEKLRRGTDAAEKAKADIADAQKKLGERQKAYKEALSNRELAEDKVKISGTNQDYENQTKAKEAFDKAYKELHKAETKLSEKQKYLELLNAENKKTAETIKQMEAKAAGAK